MRRIICLVFVLIAALSAGASDAPTLPPVVVTELKALGETYVLLDQVAGKVWPGWTGYREPPFLFTFDNGLRVLVGHPNPPKSFELVAGLRIGDRPVTVDRTAVTGVVLARPFESGGGPIPFGQTSAGAPVTVVDIKLHMARPAEKGEPRQMPATEHKVLMYEHELFHIFQNSFARMPGGNLRYNADTDYATWSNVEGLALDRAYGERDAAAARERLKDFLVARALKRRSMTDEQQKAESWEDSMEGIAVYVTMRALEVIKADGFRPQLSTADDPAYHGFGDVETMMAERRASLKKVSSTHEWPTGKCYEYGCFQALLCERLFPGWQSRAQKGEVIDAILASNVAIAGDERSTIEQRLKDDYPVAGIRADAANYVDGRDAAWNAITSRAGRTYIVDLKKTGQAVATLARRPAPAGAAPSSYSLGVVTLFPAGFPGFTLDQIEMSPTTVPMMGDQIYYVKIVDTKPDAGRPPYSVTGTKQPDGTWRDATVTTPLFTLKAPALRIRETGNRVKLQVLARVKPTT